MFDQLKPKIVIVGAGSSSFGPITLYDLFQNVLQGGGSLVLIDTNPEALERMGGVASRMCDYFGVDVTIDREREVNETTINADTVLIAAEEDRIERWRVDWEILPRFGIRHTLGENRGPAGLSHTLRTVPLVLDVCRKLEHYAPHSVVLVMTNPEDRIAYAVRKYTDMQCFGFCDGLWDFKNNYVQPLLGVRGEDLYVEAAGINHAVWIQHISNAVTGENLYERLVSEARRQGWQPFGLHLYDTFGLWPHENDEHYGEYFPYACEFIDCQGYDFDGHLDMDREWKAAIDRLNADPAGMDDFVSAAASATWKVFGDAPPSLTIKGLFQGGPVIVPNANLPNHGSIEGLPDDMIIEVPAIASRSGLHGVRWGALPGPVLAILMREGQIQKLAAEAAAEGSRRKALSALLLDPHISSPAMAAEVLDAFLNAHSEYIPDYLWRGLREGKSEVPAPPMNKEEIV